MIEENSNREFEKKEIVWRRKKRFHSHQANVREYEFSDGSKQTEFWSYSTPIVVKIGDTIYQNSQWYSVTTTRQKNRFLREIGWSMLSAIPKKEYEITRLCVW